MMLPDAEDAFTVMDFAFLHSPPLTRNQSPLASVYCRDSQAVVDILGNIQCHRPHISIILAVCVYFGHPDRFATVFKCREIHPSSLCTIEMCSKKVTVFECLGIVEYLCIKFLSAIGYP